MSALVIWMTTEEARLFHIDTDRINVERVHYHGPQHHDEVLGKNHPIHQTDEERFYRQLIENLKTDPTEKWLLMGPSFGALHFSCFLQRHFPEFHKRIIGLEKVDKMPDSEILSMGRKFLQKYYLYHTA